MRVHLLGLLFAACAISLLVWSPTNGEAPRYLTWDEVAAVRGTSGPVQVPGSICRSPPYQCPFLFDCPADGEPCFTCPLLSTTRRKCETTSQPRDVCRPIEGNFVCPEKQEGTCTAAGGMNICANQMSTGLQCSQARDLCN